MVDFDALWYQQLMGQALRWFQLSALILALPFVVWARCAGVIGEVPAGAFSFRQHRLTVRTPLRTLLGDPKRERLFLDVGEYLPKGQVRADLLYLHGFADSHHNHASLFSEWARLGVRVVAFDYPGHGGTLGEGRSDGINAFTLGQLQTLAVAVERWARQDDQRPLFVAGWSTGGLVATRLIQTGGLSDSGRPVHGALLFAPAIKVRPVIGEPSLRFPAGEVTLETLTRNPDRRGLWPIRPRSPGQVPWFSTSLLLSAMEAGRKPYPPDIPTLVLLGGDREDHYTDSPGVKRWTRRQKGALIGVQYPGAFHWLDREPGAVGANVRATAASFVEALLESKPFTPAVEGCGVLFR